MKRTIILIAILVAALLGTAHAETSLTPEASAAYAGVLRANEAAIHAYWQGGGAWNGDTYVPTAEPRAIAFADVFGDEVPELIFIARQEDAPSEATLYVYTYEDGAAQALVWHDSWQTYASDGSVMALYQSADSKELRGATLGPISGAYRWRDERGQALIEESACMGWDGDGPYYLRDGVDVGETEYSTALATIPTDVQTLVMFSVFNDPYETLDGRDLLGEPGMEAIAMTYDEAMAALDAEAQGTSSAVPAEEASAETTEGGLPESILERQLFCFDDIDGGKGLLFHADGSFTFYEINPGEYNGRLDSVEPVSAHVYRLHVAEADAVPGYEDMGAWYFHAFQPGETFCVAVPGADEGELIGGNLRPDYDEDYMGEGTSYDSSCCYVGFVGGDEETIWVPYHVWEQ